MSELDPRDLIVQLCRQFYDQGWVSGTGGGLSIRERGRVYVAPSGVQKDRLTRSDLFVLDEDGNVLETPATPGCRPSACTPLFLTAYRLRNAGAVLHSHSVNALLATLVHEDAFRVTHLEMMKGIRGVNYHDELVVPIIDNTAHEHELAGALAAAIDAYPQTQAVLVRRHGIYVWGDDWAAAKTHAECYEHLFETALRMRQLGFDPARPPEPRGTSGSRVTH